MSETRNDFSTGEHQWHSEDYVEWWIARDAGRGSERRQRLQEMLGAPAGQARGLKAHGFAPGDAIAVLDVGGGYGVVTEEVVAAFPAARVTLQDYSEPMLAAARQRLARYGERLRFVQADLRDPSWTGAVGGPFDLAVSAIAIHNLRDLAAIAACYRGIAQVLKPGARFLDYDLFDIAGGLALHQKMLAEAGFARVDCLWQRSPAATLAADKAGTGAAG